jgi:hypothetical protein
VEGDIAQTDKSNPPRGDRHPRRFFPLGASNSLASGLGLDNPMKSSRKPNASIETKTSPSRPTLRGLDWLNFFLADIQTVVGPFLAIYLAGYLPVNSYTRLKVALGEVMQMGAWAFVAACVFCNGGCMTSQLGNRMTEQASSIPNVYYQEVLNNLAMIQADPSRMPYFSDPQTARVRIDQSANVGYGMNLDLVTTAPTGVLSLFDRYFLDKFSTTFTGSQSNSGEWTALTANDPDKLFAMRAAYRRVIGLASAEDEEILSEFYYRHFEITDDALINFREHHPILYEQIGDKLARLKGIEYLNADTFERRLKAEDLLGEDEFERHRRAMIKYFRMRREPTEFVSDADTHHLLYVVALKPGWLGSGRKRDIPKTAAYVGQYGKTYVWVMPKDTELLTRLTLAILDIHTFKSERSGNSRVLPGILPR